MRDNPVLNLTLENEIWNPIYDETVPCYYLVSNLGRITNQKKIMSQCMINSGYKTTTFKINGVAYKKLVHRIVAQSFLPNLENKREVNHIDGDKLNNTVNNLEWVSSKENKKHARETGLTVYNIPTLGLKLGKESKYHNVFYDKSRSKWVGVVRVQGKNHFQKRFNTEIEAARHVNWIIDQLGLVDRPKNQV